MSVEVNGSLHAPCPSLPCLLPPLCVCPTHTAHVCVSLCKHEPQRGQSKSKFLQTAAAREPCHVCVCVCVNVCDCEVHSCGGGGVGGVEEEGVLRSEPGTTPPSSVWSPASASPFPLLRQYQLFFSVFLHFLCTLCSLPFPLIPSAACYPHLLFFPALVGVLVLLLFSSTSGHSCCSLILALAFLLSLWFPHFSPLFLPRFVQQPNGRA